MKSHLDCIPCFIKQSLEAARLATDDIVIHEKVLKQVMKHLQNISFEDMPPEISREVHHIIRNITGVNDPYKKVKDQSNEMAKKLLPHLNKLIDEADDPLLMRIKLAIVGNVIDFGTSNRFNVEDMIDKIVKQDFITDAYPRFKQVLNQSETVLYLADNAGEIFFDKLLLDEISKHVKEIILVVKTHPIINDALMEDAEKAGIHKIAKIIQGDKNQDRSTPGIIPKYASNEFKQYFKNADMVISKGQGNYESFSDCNREIFFLLMIKCPLLAEDIGEELASFVFKVKK